MQARLVPALNCTLAEIPNILAVEPIAGFYTCHEVGWVASQQMRLVPPFTVLKPLRHHTLP
jgi:hypothetical protein